ncbi:MAG: bifunctional diguanylate cyclase/phosphodiesterase [Actinomycetota bacterium]|nr:bifunctional diguanylate cyclase/phosphodiesterase [Actinomycetota bacterium]
MKSALRLLAAAVTISGMTLLAYTLATQLDRIDWTSPVFWVFAVCVLAGELMPIKIPRQNEVIWVTVSGMFAFSLIVTFGVAGALVALIPASIIDDFISKKPLWRWGFNAGVYTLAASAAGGLLYVASELPRRSTPTHFVDSDLLVIILGGLVFFAVNWCLAGTAVAFMKDAPVFATLRSNLGLDMATDGVLLTLSPLVVAAADRSLFLIPLLALPMLVAYQAARVAQRNLGLANDLREQADTNRHQALHDPLTDLPNRSLFHDRVESAISMAGRNGQGLSVVLMDLDRFKEINDALGHYNGDSLLKEVSRRLVSVVRESDTVARLGGDEFAVLISALADPGSVNRVVEELLLAFERSFELEELVLKVEASMGLAIYPQHGLDAGTLIRHADVAMYASKNSRAGYEVYQSTRDEHTRDRLALVEALRKAVANGEFELHYQPKIDVTTGRLVGAEALLRWYHDGKLIPPALFIPLAEHTGLIGPMTLWVIETAAGQGRTWEESGLPLNIAVNLSMRNLFDRGFPRQVAEAIAQQGMSPDRLALEITESGIAADPIRAEAVLADLSAMGITLSIDDFGTGHSSLSRLKRLPVDELKIDQSFVTNMVQDKSNAAIVRSIIELGHNLDLRVVAEGVETLGALTQLRDFGCDIVQGYYLGRPLSAGEFLEWREDYSREVKTVDGGRSYGPLRSLIGPEVA